MFEVFVPPKRLGVAVKCTLGQVVKHRCADPVPLVIRGEQIASQILPDPVGGPQTRRPRLELAPRRDLERPHPKRLIRKAAGAGRLPL